MTFNDEDDAAPAADFASVRGQEHAKRALKIAASSGHNGKPR
jgi:predicted ATPase with chaperone activity